MNRIKSNYVVSLRVDTTYRAYFKSEAAKRGKSVLEYSRELANKAIREETKNGFKINF